ncbi:2-amino-4-hydroxy-6-hydroxymethyldihydropteridine diphosphokinase [Microvirga sp. 2TAF3]|uniref:2-amino-4-hydroxy-6- hydroxymethyldihydropteridine diphosphokinase n=1 Tax=Microvirga sp. 2TAF3 TaxID=3233014 RepID=UPI003F9B5CED
MPEVSLSLGSNVGDKQANLARAIAILAERGVMILARSADYRSEPWGPVAQDWFVNACVLAETELAPEALLSLCLDVERELGRTREVRWGPRIIDIDILTYGDCEVNGPPLTIPHPHMLERAFVLVPLAEIAPWLSVGGQPIARALAALNQEGISRL